MKSIFFFIYSLHRNNLISLLFVSLLSMHILFERTDVRPEIFSFLFLSIFLVILFKNRARPTRLLYVLPIIELFWVNMHIYFLIGVIVSSLFFLDAVYVNRKKLKTKQVYMLGVITVLTCLVTLCNPNGIYGALYPLRVFQNYGYAIEENQNIFFLQSITNNSVIPFYELAVILLFLVLFIRVKKTRPIDWLLAILFSYIGATAIRNVPLFVFATLIPFTYHLSAIVNELLSYASKKAQQTQTNISIGIVILLTIVTVWDIFTTIESKHTGAGVIPGAKNAADFYITQQIRGPVFNNFDIGSYLEYRIFPKQRVFVDGRPEAYPAAFFTNIYEPMQEDPTIFSQIDKQYHFNSIFFAHTDQTPWASQFLKTIVHNPQWKVIYIDDTVIILVKDIEKNQPLITHFGMDEQHIRITNLQTNNIDSLFQLAHLFNELGWQQEELKMYQYIFQINPNDCNALYNTSLILQQTQPQVAEISSSKYQSYCQ